MAKDPRDVNLADLLLQARITNKLLAMQLRDAISQKDMIKVLMTTDGVTDQAIADLLGTTASTVAVTKVRIRKAEASKPGREREQE